MMQAFCDVGNSKLNILMHHSRQWCFYINIGYWSYKDKANECNGESNKKLFYHERFIHLFACNMFISRDICGFFCMTKFYCPLYLSVYWSSLIVFHPGTQTVMMETLLYYKLVITWTTYNATPQFWQNYRTNGGVRVFLSKKKNLYLNYYYLRTLRKTFWKCHAWIKQFSIEWRSYAASVILTNYITAYRVSSVYMMDTTHI